MLKAGVGRTELTPFPGVELTGWGYYIERVWRQVHDPLYSTAIAMESDGKSALVISLDLMLINSAFTESVRKSIHESLGIPESDILLTCTHSHNAPACGGLRGVGETSPEYYEFAIKKVTESAGKAWACLQPVELRLGHGRCPGLTFNRTRKNGPVDDLLTVASLLRPDGSTLAVITNFAGHPTVSTQLRPWDVSRDLPGEVCDIIEKELAGSVAIYLQGACGDTNFLPEFQNETESHIPAQRIAEFALSLIHSAEPSRTDGLSTSSGIAVLPTRRWTWEEIQSDREEALRRLENRDFQGWRETIGRSMTNRPDDMVTRHGGDEVKAVEAMCRFHLEWTDEILADYQTREEVLRTEVQAICVGELAIVSNSSEFFSPFALEVRNQSEFPYLMIACYANGRIGYLPDDHDIQAKSYAGFQSPKYCNQFPFTADSGPAMCESMLKVIRNCRLTDQSR